MVAELGLAGAFGEELSHVAPSLEYEVRINSYEEDIDFDFSTCLH